MAPALVLMIERLLPTELAVILAVHGQVLELTVPALVVTLLGTDGTSTGTNSRNAVFLD